MSPSTPMQAPLIPQWTVADRIRKARRSAGLSQQELAAKLEVPVGRLSNWEAGYNRPRNLEDVARSIESATGVPSLWILGFSPEPVVVEGEVLAGVQNWK